MAVLTRIQKALLCRDTQVKMNKPDGFVGDLYDFQKRDVAYFFFMQKALNANQTGLGKTIEVIALNCLQKQHGVLLGHVQVVPAQSLYQWYAEYRKFAPSLSVRVVVGERMDRISVYQMSFDVLLISYHMLWRDAQIVESLPYNSIGLDEASFFKNPNTKTAGIVARLALKCAYVVPMTATPIQNCVVDVWSIFQAFNMPRLLGTHAYFVNRYCIINKEFIWVKSQRRTIRRIVGYKNMKELIARISPFYVRRRVADVEQELPELLVENKWLTLHRQQRETYNEIRHDILTHNYRGVDLRSKFHSLKKTIDGLCTLDPHNPDISIKSDIVMELLQGDMFGEKVVIFCSYKASIRALCARLKKVQIDFALLWGDEPDQLVRFKIQRRLFNDPNLKVILGTTALEMSLNLQAARYMICYDLLYNPSRMTQIVGRIRRIGSPHKTNVVVNLMVNKTLEEKMWSRLNQRAAISDYVFDEKSEIFDRLTDDELYTLIKD